MLKFCLRMILLFSFFLVLEALKKINVVCQPTLSFSWGKTALAGIWASEEDF